MFCFFIAVQQATDGEKEKRTNKLISGTTQTTRPGIYEKRCKYLELCFNLSVCVFLTLKVTSKETKKILTNLCGTCDGIPDV